MLTIELVPSTAWWSNVRSLVSRGEWEKCKRFVKERSGARCEICGGVGTRYPVDCHEIWHYDDELHVQTLVGLIALCPRCHEVKHLGRAFAVGTAQRAIEHLMTVNQWSPEEAEEYIVAAFAVHDERSRFSWAVGIDYLYTEGILP